MMEDEVRQTIEEIMGKLQCPNNFQCAESGFKVLCRARRVGLEDYLECLEREALPCKFALPFRDSCICQCPVRIYVFEKLGK
ncbi:MAG: hypothetical protein ABIF19_12975 [Planctomycetota bacterium]